MDAEESLIDIAGERESIEGSHKSLKNILVVLVQSFPHEVVGAGHATGLMVSPQQHDLLRVVELEGHNEGHNFDRVGAPVHIVAQKKGVWKSITHRYLR